MSQRAINVHCLQWLGWIGAVAMTILANTLKETTLSVYQGNVHLHSATTRYLD